MDIFSHAAWGATLVRKRPLVWWALLFGVGPDILGSGPGALYLLITKGMLWGTGTWELMPQIFRESYALWHSLLGGFIIFVFLLLIGKRFLPLLFPFLFHILLDLFTHQTDILSRLFYPFLGYNNARATGINWWENRTAWWTCTATLIAINIFFWVKEGNTERL